jgi:hypothetical protein
MNTLVETAGLILGAYCVSLFRPKLSETRAYQIANLVGGLGVAAQAFQAGNLPPVALNVVWAVAALFALVRPKAHGAKPCCECEGGTDR